MVAAGAAPAALADASNEPRSQTKSGDCSKGAAGPAEAAGHGAPATPAKGSPAKGGSPRRGSCTLRELCAEDKVRTSQAALLPLRQNLSSHFYHQLG